MESVVDRGLEEWRPIEGYEGYEVSNYGRVKSVNWRRTGKVKIMSPSIDSKGYKRVKLYKKGKYEMFVVHRLVAQAFIPNPEDLPIVNHKDECPGNDCVWNLEWCDRSYNVRYNGASKRAGLHRIGNMNWVKSVEVRRKNRIYA